MTSTTLTVPDPADVSTWRDQRLDVAIRRGHRAVGRIMADYENMATITGVLLREKKRRLEHGKWEAWIEETFDGSIQTARTYMRMADERAPQTESQLSVSAIESVETIDTNGEIIDAEIVEIVDDEREAEPPLVTIEIVCPKCKGTGRLERMEDA